MDQALFHLINQQWTTPALDLVMAAVSNADIWKPFIAVVVLLALFLGGFRARACILCLLIALLISEQVTTVLKSAFRRPRPKQVQSVRLVQLQRARPEFLTVFKRPTIRYSEEADRDRSGPSFPSGHTTNNTVAATSLTVFYRRRGALYWIIAVVIGYSRIYLGAHWPSDVIATFFLAIGETLLIFAVLEISWRWAARRWLPEIFTRHPTLIVSPTT
jgi:undecaprenyl-diphosphatase